DLAEATDDPTGAALLKLFEPVLARIFLRRLGSPSRVLFPVEAGSREPSLSPRAAFLWSLIKPGMRVGEALDIAGMPPLETLRRLVSLVSCGAVRFDHGS